MVPAVQRATTPTMAAQTTPGYPGGTLVPPGVVPGAHEGHPIGPDGGGGAERCHRLGPPATTIAPP